MTHTDAHAGDRTWPSDAAITSLDQEVGSRAGEIKQAGKHEQERGRRRQRLEENSMSACHDGSVTPGDNFVGPPRAVA